jgi:hypothetical protein
MAGFELRVMRAVVERHEKAREPYTWRDLCEVVGVDFAQHWPFLLHLVDMGRVKVWPSIPTVQRSKPDFTVTRRVHPNGNWRARLAQLEMRESAASAPPSAPSAAPLNLILGKNYPTVENQTGNTRKLNHGSIGSEDPNGTRAEGSA